MTWQNLIKLAREMAAATPSDHLHQARLRPAVSSAYYAMHHALARSNAGRLSAPRNATCRSGHTGAHWGGQLSQRSLVAWHISQAVMLPGSPGHRSRWGTVCRSCRSARRRH